MDGEIRAGDLVKLKCCPQQMVVEKLGRLEGGDVSVTCVWIDDFGKPYRENYTPHVLNFVAEGVAEAMFKRKPAPKEEPVPLMIDEEKLPF